MKNNIVKHFYFTIMTVVLVGFLFICIWNGNAAMDDFVTIDLVPCSNDGLIILDKLSGREWLNLNKAGITTFNDLTGPANGCNPTCTAGSFEGWTFASEDDVVELLINAGLSPYGEEDFNLADNFMNKIGITYSFSYGFPTPGVVFVADSEAITRDKVDPSNARVVKIHKGGIASTSGSSYSAYTQQTTMSVDSGTHAWLYRDSSNSAQFCAAPTSGAFPLTVEFFNQALMAESWLWNFGDNSTSTVQNPTHKYSTPGIFTVSLTVTGANGSTTETKVDLISVTLPSFADVAHSANLANANNGYSTQFCSFANYDIATVSYYARKAYGFAEDAYIQANFAVNDTTTFWGVYAVSYAEAELNYRREALSYMDLAAQYAATGDYPTAQYYCHYGVSLNATADLYNASAIWCSSMESSAGSSGQVGTGAISPSFSSAAYYAWLSNWYLDTAFAYSVYAVSEPAYYSLVSLYAVESYQYANRALEDIQSALIAVSGDSTFWGDYAAQYAEKDLYWRSTAIESFDSAEKAYLSGDLSEANSNLNAGWWRASQADIYNSSVIWCTSMESRGGTR